MTQNRMEGDTWPIDEVADVLARRMEMSEEDAQETAEQLAEIFHGEHVIEDTEVESKQRSFLWSMLLEGLVTVETQHRPHPEHGRTWRYFYWHLVPPERLHERSEPEDEESTVYDELPVDAWRRRGGSPAAA